MKLPYTFKIENPYNTLPHYIEIVENLIALNAQVYILNESTHFYFDNKGTSPQSLKWIF